jgi:NADH:ubiquinone oxidoreductase subunit 2 (subunit N)
MVGIPLFSGFIGKWHLLSGSLTAGSTLAPLVIVIGSVLAAAYLFPIIRTAYFEQDQATDGQDPGAPQRIALILLAAGVVILGVTPGPFLELASRAAVELLAIK